VPPLFFALVFDSGWMPDAHQSCSISPPLQLDRGGKVQQKACGPRQGQGEITHQLLSQAKQIELEKINLSPINSEWDNEK